MIRAKQKQLLRDLELLGCWSECVKFTLSIQLSSLQTAAAPSPHFVTLFGQICLANTHKESPFRSLMASWVIYPVTLRKTKYICVLWRDSRLQRLTSPAGWSLNWLTAAASVAMASQVGPLGAPWQVSLEVTADILASTLPVSPLDVVVLQRTQTKTNRLAASSSCCMRCDLLKVRFRITPMHTLSITWSKWLKSPKRERRGDRCMHCPLFLHLNSFFFNLSPVKWCVT